MAITIITGKPGSGKSLWFAYKAKQILERNKRWHDKTGSPIRKVWSNIKFNDEISQQFSEYIVYWSDSFQLTKLSGVDVFWDEVATDLDSSQWANTPLEVKRFLQQHRKRGIEIYANTQDFGMIDISMRRLVQNLFILSKVVGSRDVSATKPNPKFIWGLIFIQEVDPISYSDEKKKITGLDLFFITRELVSLYDTTQDITASQYPPLRHIARECQDETCSFHRVTHV